MSETDTQTEAPTNALDVSLYFLELSKDSGVPLTQMQIQKLVYFSHGWYLAKNEGRPLIPDDIEAWRWGPVIPRLYRAFRAAGANPIRLGGAIQSRIDDDLRTI